MTMEKENPNRDLIERLTDIAGSGNVHHAYIFEGPLTANKKGIALRFAQALLCEKAPGKGCGTCPICRKIVSENHIDLTVIGATRAESRNTSSIKDDDVEKLISRMKTKPYEASRNIAVIEDADSITIRGANRLLKTLEEPPVGSVIMLLSENSTNLPVTIRSRCVQFRVARDKNETNMYSELSTQLVTQLSSGAKYHEIKKKIESIGRIREDAYMFLDSLEDEYRDRMLIVGGSIKKEQIFAAVSEIENTRVKIKRHMTVQYALKEMALTLGEQRGGING